MMTISMNGIYPLYMTVLWILHGIEIPGDDILKSRILEKIQQVKSCLTSKYNKPVNKVFVFVLYFFHCLLIHVLNSEKML
jgi:hypothetical protein